MTADNAMCEDAPKFDFGKLPMDLIPPEAMTALAGVLQFGADRYGRRAWEKGIARGRIMAALLRHCACWMSGQSLDPDSGLPHSHHILCNAAFLVTYEARGLGGKE